MRETPDAARSVRPRLTPSPVGWRRGSQGDPAQGTAFGFGARMMLAFAAAVALAGAGGYLLLEAQLAQARLGGHAADEMRAIFAAAWLAALLAGAAIFYLAAGRRLIREHRSLLHCATRDRLSDLPNLRAFQAELPDAVAAAARYGEPLALVALEVDGLEAINRRHGRRAGDAVLRVVAGVLRASRPGDRAYRVGGEGFALVPAHTDFVGLRALVRRLRRNFAEAGVEVSIGTSVLRAGLTPEMLRAEACAALEQARGAGGNRAVHFQEIRERLFASGEPSAAASAGRRRAGSSLR